MTVIYPIPLPLAPYPTKSKITLNDVVAVSESPFTLSQQAYAFPGQRFEADITLPPMRRAQAEAWTSTMSKLRGKYGTFLMGDWDGLQPQGKPLGTPVVSGANQTGGTLVTRGWAANKNGLLLPGDYIGLDQAYAASPTPPGPPRMYKVQDAVNSDSGGNASINLWPLLRLSPNDGDPIATNNCMTVWRLTSPFGWSADEVSTYAISFNAVEAL